MINEEAMRGMLENMERAAEDVLRVDPAFAEALQALKWEIDRDRTVRAAISSLQNRGKRVFSSFVPHIRIRIRTSDGVISLPPRGDLAGSSAPQQSSQLTQTLRHAASAVIVHSQYREELDRIVNEAVSRDDWFEGIASQIEDAGYEVVICLDLSAYAQIQESPAQSRRPPTPAPSLDSSNPLAQLLSTQDLNFLRALRISAIQD